MSCSSSADKTPALLTRLRLLRKLLLQINSQQKILRWLINFLQRLKTLIQQPCRAVLADNYKGYGPSIGDSLPKSEILENWKYNFDHYYASIKYNRFQNIASDITENNDAEPGEWVSNWAYCSIKYKDGRGPINIWVNSVYKIENGKISKSRVFYNEADWLRQLGYKLIKPITKKQGESL